MMTNSITNHGIVKLDEPDAHGQAALLLAESILHALVDSATLTVAEVLVVVQSAAEVKVEVAEAAGESRGRMEESLELLQRIGSSFETDARRPSGIRRVPQ